MKSTYLLALFIVIFGFGQSQSLNIYYVAYNCILPNYDTTLNVSGGDTLNFISTVNGTTNLFYSVNGRIIDTVSVSQGELIKQHIVSINDKTIRIQVWTMPGGCYGTKYHLEHLSAIPENDDNPKIVYFKTMKEIQIHNTTYNELAIFDLGGKCIKKFALKEHSLNSYYLDFEIRGIYIAVLMSQRKIFKLKLVI